MYEAPDEFLDAQAISFRVVIPTFNRPEKTRRAVESVLAQTYPHLTLVVVDDGSTDHTASVLGEIKDPRFRLVRQRNSGAPVARNTGAAGAVETYLAFLDSDDLVDLDWLEALAAAATAHPILPAILTCGFRVDLGNGASRERLPRPLPLWPGVRGCFGHAGTVAFRPSLFATAGGYAAGLPAGQNTELSHRLLRLTTPEQICEIRRPLLTYFANNTDNIRGNDLAIARGAEWQLRTHDDVYSRNRSILADMRAVAGVRFVRAGHYRHGRRFLFLSALAEPWSVKRWLRAAVSAVPFMAARLWPPSRNV